MHRWKPWMWNRWTRRSRIRYGLHMGTLPRLEVQGQCSLSQSAMTDLTSSRSTGWLCLTYRVGREVVMMHISSCCTSFSSRPSNFCCSESGAKCTYVADLCLSTGEHRRAMNSRDQINLCSQRTDLCDLTAIRTLVIF